MIPLDEGRQVGQPERLQTANTSDIEPWHPLERNVCVPPASVEVGQSIDGGSGLSGCGSRHNVELVAIDRLKNHGPPVLLFVGSGIETSSQLGGRGLGRNIAVERNLAGVGVQHVADLATARVRCWQLDNERVRSGAGAICHVHGRQVTNEPFARVHRFDGDRREFDACHSAFAQRILEPCGRDIGKSCRYGDRHGSTRRKREAREGPRPLESGDRLRHG